MGYGGTGYATVTVDIAQTDVDAIVQGITGTYGRTLTDVDNDLGNYLYYNGNTAASLLQWLLDQMGYATNSLYDIESYLSGNWYGNLYDGNSAVSYLNWIAGNTGNLEGYFAGWNYGVLNNGTYAVDYLNWIYYSTSNLESYLGGWNYGPLTDAASNLNWIGYNTSAIQDCLYDYNTYQSAASLLADIRNLLQQFSFDGSGRLRVNTTD